MYSIIASFWNFCKMFYRYKCCRYCCRRMLLGHVDLIEKLLNYAPLEKWSKVFFCIFSCSWSIKYTCTWTVNTRRSLHCWKKNLFITSHHTTLVHCWHCWALNWTCLIITVIVQHKVSQRLVFSIVDAMVFIVLRHAVSPPWRTFLADPQQCPHRARHHLTKLSISCRHPVTSSPHTALIDWQRHSNQIHIFIFTIHHGEDCWTSGEEWWRNLELLRPKVVRQPGILHDIVKKYL